MKPSARDAEIAPVYEFRPPDRAASIGAQVFARLLADIIELRFKPGQRLSENALAAEYAVSRTPVREALLRLRRNGIVEASPQVGTLVAKVDLDRYFEAQFIRETLESACVDLIVHRDEPLPASDLADLRSFLTEQRKAARRRDFRTFTVHDEGMHAHICKLSGYDHVWETIAVSKAHLDRMRRLTLVTHEIMTELIRQHARIIDALEGREASEAREAVQHHTRQTLRFAPELVDAYPDYFKQRGRERLRPREEDPPKEHGPARRDPAR